MKKEIEVNDSKLIFRILKSIFHISKVYILISIVITIITSVTPAISLLIMERIINEIQIGTMDMINIVKLILIYINIDMFQTIVSGFFAYYNTKFSLKFNLEIKKDIMKKSSELTLGYYENSFTHDIIKRAEKMDGSKLLSHFNLYVNLFGLTKLPWGRY